MDKDEKKEIKEGVETAAQQPGLQDTAPSMVNVVKSDGQRLYEVFQKSNENIMPMGSWDESQEFHVNWESFAKALMETGGKF